MINNQINVSINSNAVLVTDKIADFLAMNKIGPFVSLLCSDTFIFDQITGRPGAVGLQGLKN